MTSAGVEAHAPDIAMTDAAYGVLEDAGVSRHRHTATLIQQAVQNRLAEQFL